ncbi:MAG: endolytic transglycosylase MltG [Oscillospiraceae bacterium]|nr:endolytic transglycosylase MltG [Oscillospiraceae bacterium]MBQ6846002.1 endolytic transglycosylase MltG [Oscillospiraceae bacterium]MBQ7119843.1 endolytic transglycosylase MltG [Oscillospiraceae bacterium]
MESKKKTTSGISEGRSPKTKKKKKARLNRNFFIYIAIVFGASMLLSAWFITAVNDLLALDKESKEIIVNIPENATAADVAEILDDSGVINREYLFRFFTWLTEDEPVFPAGSYKLNSDLDYRAILRRVTSRKAVLETVTVTISEGMELENIVDLIVKNKVCEREELEEVLANADFEYDFVKKLPKGEVTRLEGYLFPDTYQFYVGDTPTRVVEKFLKNFDSKFNEDVKKRMEELKLDMHELITLASIIEREAKADDRANISSVFHNRLRDGMKLESCATIQYVLGERKTVLTIEDTKIESDYNTYKYEGLPPGPIANPGADAIEAALYPADTGYYFFALQEDGTHKFSKTYKEHQNTPKINP